MTRPVSTLLIGLFVAGIHVQPAAAQAAGQTPAPALGPSPTAGQAAQTLPATDAGQVTRNLHVVSLSRTTLLARTEDGQYRLFELTRETTRPENIPVGAIVTVTSVPGTNQDAPFATLVLVTAAPPPQAQAAQGAAPGAVGTTGTTGTTGVAVGATGTVDPNAPSEESAPVPASARQLESSIKRQTSRFRLGIQSGVALAPEVVMIGVNSQFGPFFTDKIWARPNLEFGFGELSTIIALNFEAVYRLPVGTQTSRWQSFLGGGIGLNFINKSFTDTENDSRFQDFTTDAGLNLLAGLQARSGPYFELRASAYSEPALRFMVGFHF